MNNELAYYSTGETLFKNGKMIYINKVSEQSSTHLHAHKFIEISYVASGKGIHFIGDTNYVVSKGDLFIINYDVPHEFRSLSEPDSSDLIVYNCVFKPEFLDNTLINCKDFKDITYSIMFESFFSEEDSPKSDIKILDSDSHEIEDLYEKMLFEFSHNETGYIELLKAYLIELIIKIFRLYKRNKESKKNISINRNQIIEKVISYMKDNYSEEFKLDDLSTLTFLSRNYFCKLFKSQTGMTVMEYTQKIRIKEACRILVETDKKVIDVSMEIGYTDVKFFTQIFKRITGKTPGQYRKNNI